MIWLCILTYFLLKQEVRVTACYLFTQQPVAFEISCATLPSNLNTPDSKVANYEEQRRVYNETVFSAVEDFSPPLSPMPVHFNQYFNPRRKHTVCGGALWDAVGAWVKVKYCWVLLMITECHRVITGRHLTSEWDITWYYWLLLMETI